MREKRARAPLREGGGRRENPKRAADPADPDREPEEAKGRDADGTRARILAAATDEFSANGYSGARVEAICRAAHANPRMIYHYFGDKDGLYVAVLGQVLEELRSEEMKLAVDHTPPMQGMVELFDFIQDHFARRPQLVNILTGENLLRARFLKRSIKAPIVSSPLIELIAQLLDRGTRLGVFRPGINPLRLYVMMVALAYFHRSNAFTLSAIFRTDLSSADWQRRYRKDGRAMLRSYVSSTPQSTSTRHRKRSSNSK
ncbi:MAG TPA: TetR/AcrR family transcriptional regulator [Polyangiaceae bacterium]|nr:TetR/AcrR family transcriptional regulator [Polyangiaceae bacterium]